MNDFKQPLQIDITLKRISMTAILSYVYELPDIKTKLYETIYNNYHGRQAPFPVKPIRKEIIKLASQKINAINLPKNLKSEFQGLLIFFAKKIAGWAEYVITMMQMKMSYLDEIYWTVLGTIDDCKIFESYWQKYKHFSNVLMPDSGSRNQVFVLNSACKYANEEIILANQNAMIKKIQKKFKNVNIPNIKNKTEKIIGCYLLYFADKHNESTFRANDVLKKFKETGNVNISDILTLCSGNAKCIKYLWNFLSDAEKEVIVHDLAVRNLGEGLFYGMLTFHPNDDDVTDNELEMIGLGGFAEAVLFLINEMSPKQKNEFFRDCACNVLQLFSQVWPYPEICLKVLNEDWIIEMIDDDDTDDVLYFLVFRMAKDLSDLAYVSGTCHYPTVFYDLLKKVMSIASKDDKEQVFFDEEFYCAMGKEFPYALETFFYIFDLTALDIVINDKDLEDVRELMIGLGDEKISKLIKKEKWKMVVSFMEKVLVSDEERRKFIRKWGLKDNASTIKNAEIHEKIMNWLKS